MKLNPSKSFAIIDKEDDKSNNLKINIEKQVKRVEKLDLKIQE